MPISGLKGLNLENRESQPEELPEENKVMDLFTKNQMHFMYLFNLNYSYRLKTEAIFPVGDQKFFYWDFFFLDDQIFEQHYLFQNLWRETLLLNHFNDERVQKVISFGQLPKKIIYREIEEQQGMSLAEYIENRLEQWRALYENEESGLNLSK